MKTFKIAHLYYDLMNLYGERANITALERHLNYQNLKVTTTNLSIEDDINFNDYDLFYIGSGSKKAFDLVLENILKYQKDIKKAISEKKFFLVTGNAIDLFGKSFTSLDQKVTKTLNIFNYESYEVDFQIVGEQLFLFDPVVHPILAFQNRYSVIKNNHEKPLFNVCMGTGYAPKTNEEGISKNNFYGTYLIGPLLVRNPYFTEYLVKEITKSLNISYRIYSNKIEEKAHHEYSVYLTTKIKEH